MPVRIYDIARKLGIESKEVLAKAKSLGLTGARVASSSLDKITAEYLELELLGGKRLETPPPAAPEPVVLVAPPPPAPTPAMPAPTTTGAAPAPASPPAAIPAAPAPAQTRQTDAIPSAVPPPVVAPPGIVTAREDAQRPPLSQPAPLPPAPVEPRLGDKVGFIALPRKPAPRIGEKVGFVRLPGRPAGRAEGFRGRAEGREGRSATVSGRHGAAAGGRSGTAHASREEAVAAGPAQPAGKAAGAAEVDFVPPTTGELITMKPPIVVRQLAELLGRKPFQLIAELIELGVFANVNQAIDEVLAQRICAKHGFRFEVEKRERGAGMVHAPVKKVVEEDVEDRPEDLQPRPPVITIMGHVDHGKTTLLDVIRRANVAAGEAGGITQHIGAYTIAIPHPERPSELQPITFLDTPGHAAFSAMRARGANVTDIVVLVVAANDGVMPQTLEALNHARAARVPVIVAVNKCDHPNANPMRVRQQLQDQGLVCEEWGGQTIFQDLSALTKQGVDKLLEMILLQAEVMELKANPNRRARGNVVESGLEPGGPTATVLVRKGTLRVGDVILCGAFYGKARALINEEGKRLKAAGPSVAVKVLGLNGVPEAGLEFNVVDNDKTARELAEQRAEAVRTQTDDKRAKVTLETLFDTLASESSKALKVVVKADTQGSVEAIVEALKKIESAKVALEIVHSAVGTITESDVVLASASHAIVLGFHTRLDNSAAEAAKREGIQVKLYSIIYELIDEVRDAMAGLLEPIIREVVVGVAEVRKVFNLSRGGNVAGCMVTTGRVVKGRCRVIRRKDRIFEGFTQSLRRFQDEVNEVRAGLECGIRLDGFNDLQEGDLIECHSVEKITQQL